MFLQKKIRDIQANIIFMIIFRIFHPITAMKIIRSSDYLGIGNLCKFDNQVGPKSLIFPEPYTTEGAYIPNFSFPSRLNHG